MADNTQPMQVGGQAVIEGVMMRARGVVATAVRRPDGQIMVKVEPQRMLADRYPLFKAPVLRGAVGLLEMMVVGIRALNYSAEIALADEGVPDNGKSNGFRRTIGAKKGVGLGLTVAVALLLGVALFFVTPLFITSALFSIDQKALWFNLVAGGIRVTLLLGYMGAILGMKDVRRLFEYHGAEHKAVFAHELGGPLTVSVAAVHPRFHPRCGTSFLLLVMLIAVLLFSVLDALLIRWLGGITILTRLLTHLPLIPLVGGVSYECIKLSAKHSDTLLGRMIAAPGLWLQRITTREPEGSQIEVALMALRAALGEQAPAETPAKLSLQHVAVS